MRLSRSPLRHRSACHLLIPAMLILVISACSDRSGPAAPDFSAGGPLPAAGATGSSAADARKVADFNKLEVIARQVAVSLRDSSVRAELLDAIQQSRYAERKVWFQRFLANSGVRLRGAMAVAGSLNDAGVITEANDAIPLEMYFPFPRHRQEWDGSSNIQVATLIDDNDRPVAFDLNGKRAVLDPELEPAIPTLVLTSVETDFSQDETGKPMFQMCDPETCGGGGGGGGGGGSPPAPPPPPGLYMTYAHTDDDYEGAFKGAPEFEVHVMGQKGTTDSLETEQCAGESAGAPYAFNMDDNASWTGSVMLMSQTQLNNYKTAHPSKALRILFLEDDQDPCVLKLDATKITDIISDIESVLGSQTGAKDSVSGVIKIVKKAPPLIKLFRAVYNFLQSQDEFVGNAVQDSVAGEFYPGANWILKGENTASHGYLKLEMK